MIDTVPPAGHFADCAIALRDDGGFDLTVGTAEFGNGTSYRASPDRRDRARDHGRPHQPEAIRHRAWRPRHRRLWQRRHLCRRTRDAGRGGSDWRREIKTFAASTAWAITQMLASLENDATVCAGRRTPFALFAASAQSLGKALTASGNSAGTPRSVAFNVQGFRVAVNKGTGEIRILKSVQAADAGRVANPMQCRGQVEGGVAQSLGATLYEEMVIDDDGRVINPKFRDYHLPSFADVPRTEVFFADTSDTLGPMGAKSMSESPYNPVAAALGNAHRERHRHPLHGNAVQAGPAVPGAAGEVWVKFRNTERRYYPRPTVHSIWPCGSSVGRNTSLLLSSPNAERFIRMKCMFGQAMLISEISGTAASAASPIR